MKKDINSYLIEEVTHNLFCRHCIGYKRIKRYYMPCIYLGKTKKGYIKVLVFGERFWSNREHIKKIRYVKENRLTEIKKFFLIS